MRGRTHTSFVREEATCHTVADSFTDTSTNHAARCGLRIKCAHENHFDYVEDFRKVREDDRDRAHDVDEGHSGHHLFGKTRNTLNPTNEDEARKGDDPNPC